MGKKYQEISLIEISGLLVPFVFDFIAQIDVKSKKLFQHKSLSVLLSVRVSED